MKIIMALVLVTAQGDHEVVEQWVNPTVQETKVCVSKVDVDSYCELYPVYDGVEDEEHN